MPERASPFAAEVSARSGALKLTAVPRGSIWQIACWPASFEKVQGALAEACGCNAPAPGQVAITADDRLLIRIEPLKWWIIGPDAAQCPLRPEAEDGVWLDMSHDQAAIAIEGANAAELMKRMVTIDLREAAFPDLSCATTHMHHMIIRVVRRDGAEAVRYQMMVMRSYADDLAEIAAHHIAHFG